MSEEIKSNIIEGMKLLDEDRVLKYTKKAIEQNIERMTILNWLNAGMYEVGKLYESEEYYIIELIMSEIIYTQILSLEGFDLPGQCDGDCIGTIILGTVRGDHHDIGKNIFKCMAEASGITVHDLGVDVQRGDSSMRSSNILRI